MSEPIILIEVERNAEGEVLICTGCGTVETVRSIRARSATAFTCCPERKMVRVADFGNHGGSGVEGSYQRTVQPAKVTPGGWAYDHLREDEADEATHYIVTTHEVFARDPSRDRNP